MQINIFYSTTFLLMVLVTSHKLEKGSAAAFANLSDGMTSENNFSISGNETEQIHLDDKLPKDCSQREKLKLQPINDRNSRIKKCCPIGESLSIFQENASNHMCDISQRSFIPQIINAVLYDNCIEDEELELSLPLEIRNPCNADEDRFYVMQDGSLLILDEFANDTYSVEREYCMDNDNSGKTYAFVCISSIDVHISRSSILITASLMIISIPCLLFVSYVHIAIPELRSVHGLSLASMSFSLAAGYCMESFVYIFEKWALMGYAIQFFILSYFFWFFCICLNCAINIWSFLLMKRDGKRVINVLRLAVYFFISFGGSLIFVILTAQKGFSGMPSYFLQGYTESVRESQKYFIPPITTALLGSFMILITCFFGFVKIKNNNLVSETKEGMYNVLNCCFDVQYYEEIKKDAKCISLMGMITCTTWMLEVVTFYSPGPENYLLIMDMINGLQGVFIFLIFLVVRRRRDIIFRWWHNQGSHDIEKIELSIKN